MTLDILERSLRYILAAPEILSKRLTLVWHSGEPLTVPVSFYERASELLRRLAPPELGLHFGFVTNGTLITQQWCDYFRATNSLLTLSLDGPEAIHDANRMDRRHHGTFARVMSAVSLLKANNIPFNVLSVISSASIAHADEMWDFYRSIGISSVGFNFEEAEGVHTSSTLSRSSSLLIRQFLERFDALRRESGYPLQIRELDGTSRLLNTWTRNIASPDCTPLEILTIGWDGSVSTFSPELIGIKRAEYNNFIFGHVSDDSPTSLLSNAFLQRALSDIEDGIKQCRVGCEYFCACGGGAPSNKLFENGSLASQETAHCLMRIKIPVDVQLSILEAGMYDYGKPSLGIRDRIKMLLPMHQDVPKAML